MKTTSGERPDSCMQFSNSKRLRQIVVRACIQSFNTLFYQTPCGQHQDWAFIAGISQFPTNLETTHSWKPKIQKNRVVIDTARHFETFLSCLADVYGIAVFTQ